MPMHIAHMMVILPYHSKPFKSDIIITLVTKKICDNAHHCWLCGFIQNHLNRSNKVGWPRKGMAMHKRLWFVNVINKQSNQISLYVAKSTMVHLLQKTNNEFNWPTIYHRYAQHKVHNIFIDIHIVVCVQMPMTYVFIWKLLFY